MNCPGEPLIIYPQDRHAVLRGAWSGGILAEGGAAAVIQTGIDRCADGGGGTIQLATGDFPLDAALRLAPRCVLVGTGRATRLHATGGSAVIGERAHGAELRDLALIGGDDAEGDGIRLRTCAQVRLSGLAVRGFARGIVLEQHCQLCRVSGCDLLLNRQVHVLFDSLREGPFGDYLPNDLDHCRCVGGGMGVRCVSAVVVNITGCTCHQTAGGFHILDDANSVLISGCRTFQVTGTAVLVERAREFACTGNIFCWHTGDGIVIRDAAWGTITGNEVIDTGSWNNGRPNFTLRQADLPDPPRCDAIRLEASRGFTVTGNALFNWSVCPELAAGVREDAACHDNVVVANNVNHHRGEAYPLAGARIQAAHNQAAVPNHFPVCPGLYQTFDPGGATALADAILPLHLPEPN